MFALLRAAAIIAAIAVLSPTHANRASPPPDAPSPEEPRAMASGHLADLRRAAEAARGAAATAPQVAAAIRDASARSGAVRQVYPFGQVYAPGVGQGSAAP